VNPWGHWHSHQRRAGLPAVAARGHAAWLARFEARCGKRRAGGRARPVTLRADPLAGKPITTRWSASAPRDRESRPGSGPIMSQGCTSAGTTSHGRGQRGCARPTRCSTKPASASAPGPPGTNLPKVSSKLGISSRRQLRHCLA